MISIACRRPLTVLRSTLALVAAAALVSSGCQRRGGDAPTEDVGTVSSAITAAPGDDTPLTDLANAVASANAHTLDLAQAVNAGGNADDAAGAVAQASAHMANAAAKTIDQTDARELEQTAAKKVEAAAASAHTAAAAAADAAGKAMDADDGMGRVASMAAAVTGAHAAAGNLADAVAEMAHQGSICGSFGGLRDNFTKSVSAARAARDAATFMAAKANSFAAGATGAAQAAAQALAGASIEAADSADAMSNALFAAGDALGGSQSSVDAAIADVVAQAAAHKGKARNLADKTVTAAQAGPVGNAEAHANAAKASAGDAAPTCASTTQDAAKKLASAQAAAHTSAAAMAVAAKRYLRNRIATNREQLATTSEEANLAAAKVANAAAHAMDAAGELAANQVAKQRLERAAVAAHLAGASVGAAAAKQMDAAADDAAETMSLLGAMTAAVRAASNSMADAGGAAASGAGVSGEIGQMLAMVAAGAGAANVANDQMGAIADEVALLVDDSSKTASILSIKTAAADKASANDMAKKVADAAQKHGLSGGSPGGMAAQVQAAAATDRAKARNMAETVSSMAHTLKPDGHAEAIAKTASAHTSTVATTCGGTRQDALRRMASIQAAAHTTAASLSAAVKRNALVPTQEHRLQVAQAGGEANKVAAQLGNAAARGVESARDTGASPSMAEQFEASAAAAHTMAASLGQAAAKTMDAETPDDDHASIAELAAMAGAARANQNRFSQLVADSVGAAGQSESLGQVMQMTAAAFVAANSAADEIGDVSDEVAARTERGEFHSLATAAHDNAAARVAAQKTADAAQKFSDSSRGIAGAVSDMKGSAVAEQNKAKSVAEAAAAAAHWEDTGGMAEVIANISGSGASTAPSACPSASQEGIKKIASSMAAAQIAAAGLAHAAHIAQKAKTADAISKLAHAKAEATKAASQLANAADATMEATSELTLAGATKEGMASTVAAAHAAAAGLARAAAQTATDDGAACIDEPMGDMAAMVAGVRAASNKLGQSAADVVAGATASTSAGALAQMNAVASASANTAADGVARLAHAISDTTDTPAVATVAQQLEAQIRDDAAAKVAAQKASDVSRKLSDASQTGAAAAIADMRGSAVADQQKVKQTADVAAQAAHQMAPDGVAEAMAKTSSAVAGDAPSACGGASQDAMARLVSAQAAAHTTGADLVSAARKHARVKTADSLAKLAAAKAEAMRASARLGNEAARAMGSVGELDQATGAGKAQILSAAAAAHIAAAGIGEAAARTPIDDAATCTEPVMPELAAMVASTRTAANVVSQAAGSVLANRAVSSSAGRMAQMASFGAASANAGAEAAFFMADQVAKVTADTNKASQLRNLRDTLADRATALAMSGKAADVAKQFSNAAGVVAGMGDQLRAAATADKGKARQVAEQATATSGAFASNSNAQTISMTASAGASDAPEACAGGRAETIAKLGSAVTAADTAAANLVAAQKRVVEARTAEAVGKLAHAKGEAISAAAMLAGAAAHAMDEVATQNLSGSVAEQLEGTATMAHTMAAAMAHAASKTVVDDTAACNDSTASSDMAAMVAAQRGAANGMAQTVGALVTGKTASRDVGRAAQISSMAHAATNTAADQVGRVAGSEAAQQSDSNKAAAMQNIRTAANDNATALTMAQKVAAAAQKMSDSTRDPSTAGADLVAAAQADRSRARSMADTVASAASTVTPNGNAAAIARTASAGVTDAPASCGGASPGGMKRLVSSFAAADTMAAVVAAATTKVASAHTADSIAKMAHVVGQASKVASQLGNSAAKTLDAAGSMGLSTAAYGRALTVVATSHSMAATIANMSAQTNLDDGATCAGTAAADLGAMLAMAHMGTNNMARIVGDIPGNASPGAGQMAQMVASMSANANTTSDEVATAADIVAAATTDPAKQSALIAVRNAARDDAAAKVMAQKTSTAAQAFSGSGASTSTSAADVVSAAATHMTKAKTMADVVITNANRQAPGGQAEAISKMARAGSTDVAASAANAAHDNMVKLGSSMAAAQVAAAGLAHASNMAARVQNAEANARKETAAQEANKAAAHLAKTATSTLDMATTLSLSATQMAHTEAAVASSLTLAASLAQASAEAATNDGAVCGETSATPDVGGMAAAVRASAHNYTQAVTQTLTGAPASQRAGQMTQMAAATVAAANTAVQKGGDMAAQVASVTPNPGMAAAINSYRQASQDQATSLGMANKVAEAAHVFSNGGSAATAISNMSGSAVAEKTKAKSMADVVSNMANTLQPGTNTVAISKLASAAVTGDPATGAAPTAADVAEKRMAAALAAAHTTGAAVANAAARVQAQRSAAAMANLEATIGEAQNASAQVGNAAAKTMDTASGFGFAASKLAQLESAGAAAQVSAAGLAHAGAEKTTADADVCGMASRIPELGGIMASTRGAANQVAQASAQHLGSTPTGTAARLAQMSGSATAASNTAAKKVSQIAGSEAAQTSDPGMAAQINSMAAAGNDRATAETMANRVAEAAQTFAGGGGSAATAVSNMSGAAVADQVKARGVADAAASAAGAMQPGGNAAAISKMASAVTTGTPTESMLAVSLQANMAKLNASNAAAASAMAHLSAAHGSIVGNIRTTSLARTSEAVTAMNGAAAQLLSTASAVSNASGGLGLSATNLAQLRSSVAAAQSAATAQSGAATQAANAIANACAGNAASVPYLAGAVSATNTAANSLAQTTSQLLLQGQAASNARARFAVLMGSSVGGANVSTRSLTDVSGLAASRALDAGVAASLNAIKTAASNNASALLLADRAGTTSQAFAGVGSVSTALTNLGSAISGEQTFLSGLNAVAPATLPVTQLPNGDLRFAITFPAQQAYVEAFIKKNGTQIAAGNIVTSRVANPDGTSTYSRVLAASSFVAGDVVNVRFYSYVSGGQGVFTPGPTDTLSYPEFIYGLGSTTYTSGCRPTYTQLANGDVKITATFTTPQSYVEAFVRRNGTQIAAGNIVSSGVANFDGRFSYTRTLAASSFQAGDTVTYRFYSYVNGQPAVFTPGPSSSTFFPGVTYGSTATPLCQ